jgi:hypothetical protein
MQFNIFTILVFLCVFLTVSCEKQQLSRSRTPQKVKFGFILNQNKATTTSKSKTNKSKILKNNLKSNIDPTDVSKFIIFTANNAKNEVASCFNSVVHAKDNFERLDKVFNIVQKHRNIIVISALSLMLRKGLSDARLTY